ncbi:MutS-like protein [Mobilisporobacter senegalensis]|uniref:MutS-like protein n=1 Tax=Mobilisporobacter senegalensis TaxID=1329262 RepID=A0A3N1XW16_9FIRM|nr:hypothetical protein [Mobilisporobacter senegalensis]ROR29382.1 MutS-like protein [Mobilisporobacter senegalensis]
MEYLYIFLAILVFLIFKSRYDEKENRRKLYHKLKQAWGEIPDEEYTSEKFESIKKYYLSVKDKDLDIDDITYNDLDLKEIYMMLNNTGSAIGEEYLYALLRKPVFSEEELLERNRLMNYFESHEEDRLKLQTQFALMGKLNKLSIYEYINRTDNIQSINIAKEYFMALGLVASIAAILINPMIGGSLTVFFIANNMITYFKKKAEIESYFTVFSYILRLLNEIKEIRKLNIPQIENYTKIFEEAEVAFRKFKKGSRIVISGNAMAGDIADMILDYLRMLFHVDIIKFNTMLTTLRKNRDILNGLYENIGYLDSMIAAASFRKQIDYYSEPKLVSGTKPYLKVEDIFHPILEEPVVNSIKADRSVLITGSNASGKSTFIKTMAINAILSQTIYTSVSKSYEASYFRVFSSMALRDDIFSNESYYIVEIKSLKRILDKINGKYPVLCFVDEVLRGTNTLERIAASTQILHSLSQGNTLCFAATHDIELTAILENHFDNFHFMEKVQENDILFDYKLYSGRAVSKNAIKLLEIMGYSKDIIEHANELANEFLLNGNWVPLT